MPDESKNALQLTDDELREIAKHDPDRTRRVQSQLRQAREIFEQEITYMKTSLADTTQRTALLMTIASFFTFIPTISSLGETHLKHFLVWSFPLFIISLFPFYFSSPRVVAIISRFQVASDGTPEQLTNTRARVASLQHIWRTSHKQFRKSQNLSTISATLIYMYLISIVINLYLFAFIGKPSMSMSLWVLSIVVCVGVQILLSSFFSRFKLNFGPKKDGDSNSINNPPSQQTTT